MVAGTRQDTRLISVLSSVKMNEYVFPFAFLI